MISIKEIYPPRKIPGLTSFIINFDFRPDIVEVLKALPVYYYHKKDYTWEIPISCLSKALDSLTKLDEIKLELLNGSYFNENDLDKVSIQSDTQNQSGSVTQAQNSISSTDLTSAEVENFKKLPFQHQIEAVNYGLRHKKWLLLDGMGLGKTGSSIYLAETLHKRGEIEHCLVICGVNSLKSNWKAEINKFSNETCIILGEKVSRTGTVSFESISKRIEQLKNPIDEFFVITNIESLRNDKFIEALKKSPNKFGLIVCDEIHKTSNKNSQQGHNLLKLDADYIVGLTGTLLSASPLSAYLPLSWIGAEKSTLTTFKALFCRFGGFNNSQIIGYKNLNILQEELHNYAIRRTMDQVTTLPPKTLITELVDMSDEHRKFYEAIKDGVKEEADKIELNSSNLLALTTRLRQATACPGILTTNDISSSKVERCIEIIEELISQGEKVVVMSSFKEPVYRLADALKKYDPLVCTGDIPDGTVADNVEKFSNCPDFKIILCTHQRMGTGFSLNAASYLIMLDEMWTHAQNAQSHDRIYRINNTRPVFIITLICKDTIDERVHDVSEYKKDLSDYVVDGKENELAASLRSEMTKIIKEL